MKQIIFLLLLRPEWSRRRVKKIVLKQTNLKMYAFQNHSFIKSLGEAGFCTIDVIGMIVSYTTILRNKTNKKRRNKSNECLD